MSGLHRRQHVGRIARGGERQQHVASLPERSHLARVDRAHIKIVGDAGEHRSIRRERKRRQLGALPVVTADKAGSEVLGSSGRCTVAARQHLATTSDAGQHRVGGRLDHGRKRLRTLVFQVGAVDELLLDALQKHGAIIAVGSVSNCSRRVEGRTQPVEVATAAVDEHDVEAAWGF